MNTRRLTRAFVFAAALSLALAIPAVAADPGRPFAGRAVGVDTQAAPADCPAGAMGLDTIVSHGQFLHLGLVEVVSVHCTFFDPLTLTGTFGPGTTTITAANGDVLVLRHVGSFRLDAFPPTVSHATVAWEIVDGTGRFADASGEGTSTGVVEIATGTVTLSYAGTIAY